MIGAVLRAGALTAPLAAAGPAAADPTFPTPVDEPPLSAIRSYGDMITELRRLAESSRYPVTVFTLSDVGTDGALSERGRELCVATVGTGPRRSGCRAGSTATSLTGGSRS